MRNPLPSVDLDTGEEVMAHFERSDVCQVPPAGVIGESMMALVIAKCMIDKFGGDSMSEIKRNYNGYIETVKPRKTYR
jgi:chorismate synthase